MTFYRVSYSRDGGNSAGFSWHTSRRGAVAAARADYDADPEEYNLHSSRGASIADRIQAIIIRPTRAGILDALQRYASHEDNG